MIFAALNFFQPNRLHLAELAVFVELVTVGLPVLRLAVLDFAKRIVPEPVVAQPLQDLLAGTWRTAAIVVAAIVVAAVGSTQGPESLAVQGRRGIHASTVVVRPIELPTLPANFRCSACPCVAVVVAVAGADASQLTDY